jgi:peptidoglycan/xylan/chitin deacetylase (PgdA/CDA1 family)
MVVLATVGAVLAGCAQPGTRPAADPAVAPSASAEASGAAGIGDASASPSPSGRTATARAPRHSDRTATAGNAPRHSGTAGNAPRHSGRFNGPANSATRTRGDGVALTFDDGPDPIQTPKILDLLAKYHVKATFCLVGVNVQAHPELVRRIVAEGHTVCNHTWHHSLTLGTEPPAAIRDDLQRTNDAIHRAAPDAKIKYMRAPGGNFTPAFVSVAADMNMTSIYWHVDPRDWDHPVGESPAAHRARVIAAVETQVRNGSIVLSHDYGQPDTIAAYRTLIPWLQVRYTLVALP